ncbi:MAG TPA: mechanosensitive ion channel family protein [Solirubrobacteraceae bacterium]|nr:mechanosensitive ion channel family protein [Solirubrobacteraceae bacterium]
MLVLADITAAQLHDTCGRDPDFACRELLQHTENRTLAQIADAVVGTPLTIAVIVLGALLANKLAGRAIDRGLRSLGSGVMRERVSAVRRRGQGAPADTPEATLRAERRISALTSILRSVAGFVILLFATFMVLSEVGIDVAPLLAGAGVLGVALGFGSQSLVKDFLSGMFILVEDQFGVGDIVDLDDKTTGTVEAVTLRTTRLRAKDGTVWYVPNGSIMRVGNRSQHWSRTVIEIEVAPGADVEQAERAVRRAAHALCRDSDEILEEPEVMGTDVRDDAIVIQLALKTLTADQDEIVRELRERLRVEFARDGIELPARPDGADSPVEAAGADATAADARAADARAEDAKCDERP